MKDKHALMKQSGVTLIELVVVLVILGAISIGIASFVRNSIDSAVGIANREQLLSASRFAVERLRKELSSAIPNSIRINKTNGEHCLQFVPFDWVSVYLDLPIAQETNYIASLPIIAPTDIDGVVHEISPNNDVAIIYPLRPEDIYEAGTLDNEDRKIRTIIACPLNDCTAFTDHTLTLTVDNGFPENSPAERVYIAREAVSFCVVNNELVRFSGAISQTQPMSSNSSAIIADNITNILIAGSSTQASEDDPFQFFESSRLRNGVIQVRLRFTINNDELTFQQEVHIPNAP